MNILYFHVHDQGRFIQPYGYPVSTPNLQTFAEEGVLFRNAFCTTPSCSPSRAALLTGQYPHQNGMFGLTNEGWVLNDYSKHLRKTLSDHGFETVLAGTHHVTPHTEEGVQRLGYDRVLIEEDEADLGEVRTSAAINYLREEHDKPFFLALGYDITHRSKWERSFVHSYARYGDLDARYTRPVPGCPDTPELREEAALQFRASEFQDCQFGRIMEELDRLGLRDDTLVLYTTDHGPGLAGMKLNLTDGGTGVSLIMRKPGRIGGGKVLEGLVSQIDLYPTLCDLLDIPRPAWLEGESLLPLIDGTKENVREYVFNEQNCHGKPRPLRSVRDKRYRYVRRIGEEKTRDHYLTDRGASKELAENHGFADQVMPKEQLFDTFLDPHEAHNVVDAPEYAEEVERLRAALTEWMKQTDDPALHDTIPEQPERPQWAVDRGNKKADWGKTWVKWYEALNTRNK